jgi:hypothetical protein
MREEAFSGCKADGGEGSAAVDEVVQLGAMEGNAAGVFRGASIVR